MANIFRFFLNLVKLTIIFVTVFFLALYLFVRSIPRILDFYSPITTAQFFKLIETKNPTSYYDSATNDQSEECSVCLSTFENGEEIRKLKQCNHSFHKYCLDVWFRHDRPTCPLCRASALPERIVARYRRQHNTQVFIGTKEEISMLLSAVHRHFLTRQSCITRLPILNIGGRALSRLSIHGGGTKDNFMKYSDASSNWRSMEVVG
ncbi:Zinc finger, RING/FYVE/PHD-type [Heracleum sosnowskyi]|uniref:Zinc finger, RING/FYVE/PHD-type n=1 Tax=Heracleum sosnowskyi TaxID=360622 RepID=A0AAD8JHB1_9APIA|nr:Zinc finger, RING/FYVE/PHD-type [Heracleum sosnowskyi]